MSENEEIFGKSLCVVDGKTSQDDIHMSIKGLRRYRVKRLVRSLYLPYYGAELSQSLKGGFFIGKKGVKQV